MAKRNQKDNVFYGGTRPKRLYNQFQRTMWFIGTSSILKAEKVLQNITRAISYKHFTSIHAQPLQWLHFSSSGRITGVDRVEHVPGNRINITHFLPVSLLRSKRTCPYLRQKRVRSFPIPTQAVFNCSGKKKIDVYGHTYI